MDGVKLVDDTVTPYTYRRRPSRPARTTIYATVTDSLGNINTTLNQRWSGRRRPRWSTTDPDIWRLLNQATFGASQAEAARVMQLGGIAGWINDQFTQADVGLSGHASTTGSSSARRADCTTQMPGGVNYPGRLAAGDVRARSPDARDDAARLLHQRACTAPDQLRQRVAWALSQIVVTSANEPDLAVRARDVALPEHHVRGSVRQLRDAAAQGHVQPGDGQLPRHGQQRPARPGDQPRVPNENYAREIMQLFSIGLVELNADGTPILDAQGSTIPTYGQDEIAEFARVFTGYTYSSAANPAARPRPSRAATTARRWCRTRRRQRWATTRTPRRC